MCTTDNLDPPQFFGYFEAVNVKELWERHWSKRKGES